MHQVFQKELGDAGSLRGYKLSKLQRWSASGTKFISLAGAGEFCSYLNPPVNILIITSGSVYLLMLIACCNMRKLIIDLPSSLVSHLSSLIRYPSYGKGQIGLYCLELKDNTFCREK
jgi:hypothetical protein